MARMLLTQAIPILLPIRQVQKKTFFYLKMKLDNNKYAKNISDEMLEYKIYEDSSLLINENSGFDIEYQYNKVHNLKLVAETISKLIIEPNETFSFWFCAKNIKKYGEYKNGLNLIRGKVSEVKGGGLCQLSNMLFILFLHSPLSILERKGHESLGIPPTNFDDIVGADATINEGWIDLKVKNDSDKTFQIIIEFDSENMYGKLLCNQESKEEYKIHNKKVMFYKQNEKIFQSYSVDKSVYLNNKIIYEEELFCEERQVTYDSQLIKHKIEKR